MSKTIRWMIAIAALLNKNYIFADTAKKMEDEIRSRLENGALLYQRTRPK